MINALRKPFSICGLAILICLGSHPEAASAANNDLVIVSGVANDAGGVDYSLSLQVLLIMTALTLLPATIMAVTSFTRIVVVLAILRQALGLMQTPSNQTLLGLALFLSIFIMSSVLDQAWSNGIQPYLDEEIDFNSAYEETVEPFRDFMLAQVRENDIVFFSELRGLPVPADASEIPMIVLVPAFMTSELKTAFQIGFMLFIPFLVIDLVVSSVLMSMGMMMLSPMLISLPFKIMLFVLVDGWTLVLGTLAESFSN